MQDTYTVDVVCKILAATADEINHAHKRGGVPVPVNRVYSEREIGRLREAVELSRLPQTGAVAKSLGINYRQLWYAVHTGSLRTPKHRFGKWWVWTGQEIERARKLFAMRAGT